jgi:colanic acid/amylovoran biosynthesis protein
MMGMITAQKLFDLFSGECIIYCDFQKPEDKEVSLRELSEVSDAAIQPYVPELRFGQKIGRKKLLGIAAKKRVTHNADLIVVLGGDDISEYYDVRIWKQIANLWTLTRDAPTILLGQTLGPFDRRANLAAAKLFFPAMHIFPRDRWCTGYLKDELGLTRRVHQSTDLAYADLPLQHRADIRDSVLEAHGLQPDGYATMIVSGLGSKYYTPDRNLFLDRHAAIANAIMGRAEMAGRKLCLLAHTFGIYGNEADNVRAVHERLAPDVAARTVLVTDQIMPTRARFVLGNGLFTVTGRMHPAVSTFQMGKPAISLAYSKKYEGVIGTMLGRSDLIIEANDAALWDSGAVVDAVEARVGYALENYARLTADIRARVEAQKQTVDATFSAIRALV